MQNDIMYSKIRKFDMKCLHVRQVGAKIYERIRAINLQKSQLESAESSLQDIVQNYLPLIKLVLLAKNYDPQNVGASDDLNRLIECVNLFKINSIHN